MGELFMNFSKVLGLALGFTVSKHPFYIFFSYKAFATTIAEMTRR